ncbi:MAG: sugar phosphate isomerase/epimerase family protein [Kiritimatiellia bacterium]|jgi:L-ribulose-5-phosphate 3-epimerase
MQRGISYWSFKNGMDHTHPIADALKEARQAGFEALELCIAETGVLNVKSTKKECTEIRKLIEDSGLVVDSVASGLSWTYSPTHPDAAIRRKAVALQKAALLRCAWLGCRSLLLVPGAVRIPWDPGYPSVPYEQAVINAAKCVREMLKTAEKYDVEICVENVWNGMFYSPLEFRTFIDVFESPLVKAYFDIGNVLGYHQDPADWIRLLGPRIGRVHAKDFKRDVGTLAGFCDLGKGDVCWPEVAAALRKAGYKRTVIAEMTTWRPGLIKRTAKALKELIPAE